MLCFDSHASARETHPCPESQEELSLLICVQQVGHDFCDCADELLHHPIVLNAPPLHDVPHGRRHQAQRGYEEAKRWQQERWIWKIFDGIKKVLIENLNLQPSKNICTVLYCNCTAVVKAQWEWRERLGSAFPTISMK